MNKLPKRIAWIVAIGIGGSLAMGITAGMADHTERGVRTVTWHRGAPCTTCGAAAPIIITCEGLDWQIYKAGAVQDMAASVCPAGSHYTWKVMP